MRCKPTIPALGAGLVLMSCAGSYAATGNDTGGIIPWSPENQRQAFAIATRECARYDKYPRITSMNTRPGDYIGYRCVWSPRARP